VPNPKNNNKHPKEQIERLAKIIDFQGQRSPVVVSNRSGFIVKGHGRLEAIKKLGWDKCAVDYQDYESEAQEYADMVADNQIATWAEFDTQMVLDELPELDIDTDMLGMVEIPEIETEESEVVEDEVPEEVETRCKRGDIWQLGEHRLMCGDSTCITDVEKLMNGQKVDLLFTDPPYGVSYEKKTKEVLKSKSYTKIQNDDLTLDQFQDFLYDVFTNAFSCLKETASYYVFSCQGGDQEMMMMMMMRQAGIPCRHQIIWVKDAPVFSMGRLDYDYKHEPILYGWVKKHDFQRNGEQDKSVWEYKRTANKLHPTMKPVELIANALLNSTKSEENVLDLFGGSGSTLIACEQLNRKCFMMELDEHYCDVIIQRWENLTGKTAERIENENN
jgi:site-specific DNA-methyltransferase (adenine-specific)